MHILIIGSGDTADALAQRLPGHVSPAIVAGIPQHLEAYDIIFHADADRQPGALAQLLALKGQVVVVASVLSPLAEQVAQARSAPQCLLFGYDNWPEFLSAERWEVVSYHDTERYALEEKLLDLGIAPEWVADSVGLVRPRILSMIVNEAYFMLGEGAADAQAIDQALRLGVNYPEGPVTWGKRIGLERIAALLRRLGQDLGNDTYHPSPALAQAVWRAQV